MIKSIPVGLQMAKSITVDLQITKSIDDMPFQVKNILYSQHPSYQVKNVYL